MAIITAADAFNQLKFVMVIQQIFMAIINRQIICVVYGITLPL
jgi:hypothetical protein